MGDAGLHLQLSRDADERLGFDLRAVLFVDPLPDDEVDEAGFVFEGHEDDASRRAGPLAADDEAGVAGAGTVFHGGDAGGVGQALPREGLVVGRDGVAVGAVAEIADGVDVNMTNLRKLGKLKGLGSDFLDEGTKVSKIGRTTDLTHGRVTAFELDDVTIGFDMGDLRFDGTIEIEGYGDAPFCLGGDSGSLIVDKDLRAVALLFAGSDQGGANSQGLTYANPIQTVLDALKVDLVF